MTTIQQVECKSKQKIYDDFIFFDEKSDFAITDGVVFKNFYPENIADELKALPIWAPYRLVEYEPDDLNDGHRPMPVSPETGEPIEINASKTMYTFEQSVAYFNEKKSKYKDASTIFGVGILVPENFDFTVLQCVNMSSLSFIENLKFENYDQYLNSYSDSPNTCETNIFLRAPKPDAPLPLCNYRFWLPGEFIQISGFVEKKPIAEGGTKLQDVVKAIGISDFVSDLIEDGSMNDPVFVDGRVKYAEIFLKDDPKSKYMQDNLNFWTDRLFQIRHIALQAQLKNLTSPVEHFDTSVLPAVVADYINDKCSETNASSIIITQSVISTISAVLGKRLVFHGYFQPLFANLWSITISVSGAFKSTALRKGSEIAFRIHNRVLDDLIRNDEFFQGEDKKDEKKRIQAENLIMKRSPILPDSGSGHGVFEILKTEPGSENHNGAMFVASEFGELAKNLGNNFNNGYKQFLTNVYDVPDSWSSKTKTGGLILLRCPFITINSVSTLAWVQANINLEDFESGFFSRFLLFYPPEDVTIPPALPADKVLRPGFVRPLERTLTGFNGTREYTLVGSSRRMFEQIHNQMYADAEKLPDKLKTTITPYLKRWSPSILKIAMLLEAVTNPQRNTILSDSIMGAASVVEYAARSTKFLFENQLGESDQQKKQRKVKEYIARKGGDVTRKALLISRVLDGGHLEYNYVLESLEASGEIEIEKNGSKTMDSIYRLCI